MSDENIIGANNLPVYQAGRNSTYLDIATALLRIRYYLDGRQTDTASIRTPLSRWLAMAPSSTDPVFRESVQGLRNALQQLTQLSGSSDPATQETVQRAQRMLTLFDQAQSGTRGEASPSAPAPTVPPRSEAAPAPRAPASTPSTSSSGTSVGSLRRRSERAVTRANTTCEAHPTDQACLTARTAAARATAAYRDAVCEETPRAEACTSARSAAESAQAARDGARAGVGTPHSSERRGTPPDSSAPPLPPPLPTEEAGH